MNLGINKKWFSTWVIIKNMECFVSNRSERQHSSPEGPYGFHGGTAAESFFKRKISTRVINNRINKLLIYDFDII